MSSTLFYLIPLLIISVLSIHKLLFLQNILYNVSVMQSALVTDVVEDAAVAAQQSDNDTDRRSLSPPKNMLKLVSFAFFVSLFPFYFRKFYQHFTFHQFMLRGFSQIINPLTFLIMFANSGTNPIIYAATCTGLRINFKNIFSRCGRSIRSKILAQGDYHVDLNMSVVLSQAL